MIASSPSVINPNTMITSETWGVTLTVDVKKNHARLVFEGIKNNEHFYRMAHLKGSCKLEKGCFMLYSNKAIVDITEPRPKEMFKAVFAKKTATYLAKKDTIKELITEIKKEKDLEVPFNILGNKSILSKASEIYHIYDKALSKLKDKDSNLFLSLYTDYLNNGKCLEINSKKADEVTLAVNKHLENEKFSYSELIQMCKISVMKEEKYQDNCFTWATTKLKKISPEVGGGWGENIVSITRLYIRATPEMVLQPIECKKIENQLVLEKSKEIKFYDRFVSYNYESRALKVIKIIVIAPKNVGLFLNNKVLLNEKIIFLKDEMISSVVDFSNNLVDLTGIVIDVACSVNDVACSLGHFVNNSWFKFAVDSSKELL